MFISTLDGQFIAVYRNTGRVLWSLRQDPVLKMTSDMSKGMPTCNYDTIRSNERKTGPMSNPFFVIFKGPIFLPDPRDGSLYTFGGRKSEKDLTKLPFTVS